MDGAVAIDAEFVEGWQVGANLRMPAFGSILRRNSENAVYVCGLAGLSVR
jgi:hypothetical protein